MGRKYEFGIYLGAMKELKRAILNKVQDETGDTAHDQFYNEVSGDAKRISLDRFAKVEEELDACERKMRVKISRSIGL